MVEVAPPLKSDAWKAVATDADKDRIARLDFAWQQALTEAGKSFSSEIRKEGDLLKPRAALPRPAPTPGSYNCRLIKLGQAEPKTRAYRELQALLLLRRSRGRPADHRQADRQPEAGGPAVGGRRSEPADLPRQPCARQRGPAARLWRRSQAQHGGRVPAHRPVPLAAGDSVAAEHVQARRVRADSGRATAAADERNAGLLADPAEVRAILIASAQAGEAISYSEVLALLGHRFLAAEDARAVQGAELCR